jgi:hypothetical protein
MTLGAILASLLAVSAASDESASALPVAPSVGASTCPAEEAAPADGAPAAHPYEPAPADSSPVLLSRVEHSDGSALERLIEPTGDVVEHELNPAGTVLSCRVVGSLLSLRLVEQRLAAGGEFVQVARDDASGAVVRYAVALDGEPRAVVVVGPAPPAP